MFLHDPKPRGNNNSRTTMAIGVPSVQVSDSRPMKARTSKFVDSPTKAAATRQSYQDSDIFGTKRGKETVQPSAYSQKEQRTREVKTFISKVVTSDERSLNIEKNVFHKDPGHRLENRWTSTVFAGPLEHTKS